MRTIEDVLDEMIGVNYMVTQAQIQEIRDIHLAETAFRLGESAGRCARYASEAYEAGRKHDKQELDRIMTAINEDVRTDMEECGLIKKEGDG